jgi:hypothetical protein
MIHAADVVEREVRWDRIARQTAREQDQRWAAMQAAVDGCRCTTKSVEFDDCAAVGCAGGCGTDPTLKRWFHEQLLTSRSYQQRTCAGRSGGVCAVHKSAGDMPLYQRYGHLK